MKFLNLICIIFFFKSSLFKIKTIDFFQKIFEKYFWVFFIFLSFFVYFMIEILTFGFEKRVLSKSLTPEYFFFIFDIVMDLYFIFNITLIFLFIDSFIKIYKSKKHILININKNIFNLSFVVFTILLMLFFGGFWFLIFVYLIENEEIKNKILNLFFNPKKFIENLKKDT